MSLYWRPFIACLLVLISLALLSALPLGAIGQSKTVLAIYSDERLLPANIAVDTALRDSLGLETDNPRTYLSEFLDVSRFGSSDYDKLLSDFFHSKYTGQHLDVIVASGPLAFQFLRRHQADLFTGIPVVLCGVGRESFESQTLPPNFVGVPIAVESLPTIELALRLQPDAREIVIVTGTSEFYRSLEDTLRRDLPHLQTSIPIRYLSGLPLDDLLRELSPLSPNSIVYSPGLLRDSAGRTYIPHDVLRRMADASTAPIYGSYSTYVGSGIVGGYMFTMEDLGRQAAGLVRKVLDGEKLSQADTSVAPPSRYMFDWKQLQRWHIPEKNLPPGSIVLYRELSVWQRYKPYIIGSLSLILVQTLLILALLWQRAAKRKVKADLILAHVRLHSAMVSGKAVGWEWDLKSERDSWFGDLKTMFGIPSEARVGRPEDLYRYVHPEDRQRVSEAVAEARRSHQPYRAQFRVVWPDGTLRWVSAEGKFYYSPEGEPERMLGMAVDITDRKQAEQAVRQSEAELREAQRLANVGSWRWDPRTDTVTWSEELYRIAGLDPGLPAVSYKEHSKLYTAESWDCLRRAVEEALRTGTPYELDLEMIRFDGARRRLIAKGEVRRDSTGQIVQLRGTVHDITERKRTEEALRESDERLRLAVQAGRMYAFEWDIASDVIVRTGQCRDILNWMDDPTRDTGRQFVTRVHPDDREAYSSPQTWLTPENPSYQTSYRVLRPDGAVIWLEASGRVLFDAEGKRLRIVGLVADVTARKLAEEARRESDERLRLAQEAVHVGVFEWDIQKNENRWSPELERIYGLTPGSFGGTYEAWIAHVHPEDRERFKWDDRWNLQDGGFFASEYRIVKPSGEIRWLNTRGTLSCDSAGRPVRLLGFSIDITERKTAEEALRESEARERARVKELETLLDAAPITILIAMDAECKSITANRTASRLHHVPIGTNISLSAPAVGLPLPFRIMRDGVEIPVQELPLQRAAATGIPVIGTFSTLVLEDGTEHYMFGNTAPLFGEDGKPCGAVGAFVDITEHKRAEDALRQSEERLRLAAQAGKMFAYEWDATTDVVVRSPESAKILGIDEATHLTGQQILAKVHPGDRERLLSAVAELSPEKPYLEITYRMERPDGTEIWVERNSRAQFDGQGRMQRIVGMVADITERKRVELALRESEERLHLAFQAGGMYAYEWDPLTDRGTRTAECINILGKDAPLQITRRELSARVHPDDREQFAANPSQITPEHPNSHMTYRVLRHDGSVIWLEKRARAFFDEQGRMLRMIGVVADVTARKHAEEALRESEERFRLVANTAPVMIWMSGPDKQCNYFNQPWLDFTGRAIESELGNGWAEGVLLEDFKTCLETYTNAFDRREKFSMEYRLRRYDGEYRWVLDIGVPRFNQDGSFAGYIGSCLDVTERKRAEEALSSVSRRLIEAQEQERTRIARELHDDIGQRLALLTIELEQLRQNSPDLPAEVRRRFGELQTLTSEIATDVQSLSHELHSSRLEYLGIAAAMKAFCQEFANQQNVEVVFAHDEVPRTLPQEISLCLFRVLQEALQNAVKHSGMRHFDVELHYASDAIDLNVRDSGRGFDVEGAMQAQGLGLISMAERLKLVGGQLSIDSQSQRGTTIRASVPLSNAARASA